MLRRIDQTDSPDAIPIYEGSDNIFADLGLPDAELLLAKAELMRAITLAIDERNLTQAEAARIMKTTQPKVSALLHGHIDRFTLDRLVRYLNALGKEVMLIVQDKPAADGPSSCAGGASPTTPDTAGIHADRSGL